MSMFIAKRKHTKSDGNTQWLPVGMTLWVNQQPDGSVRYSISDNRTGEQFSCFPLENRGGGGGGQRGQSYGGGLPPHTPGGPVGTDVPYGAPPPTPPGNPVPPGVPQQQQPVEHNDPGYGQEPEW